MGQRRARERVEGLIWEVAGIPARRAASREAEGTKVAGQRGGAGREVEVVALRSGVSKSLCEKVC